MVTEPDTTWDKDELKRRVDLREVVAEAWGPGRSGGKATMYRARWREGDRTPSFAVFADGFKDFGGAGEAGDVYTWLEREFGMTFAEALGWLRARVHGPAAPPRVPRCRRGLTATDEPPPADWQHAAAEALGRAQAYLWSGAPDAALARRYLAEARGLSEETMRARGLGYAPGWLRTRYRYWSETLRRRRRARLAPGIVIPWYRDDILVALRVRCRVGALAGWLGQAPDRMRGEPLGKYRSLSGSRLSGTLYPGCRHDLDCPLLVVEGEFDALLAAQHAGTDFQVVTLGSAALRLTRRLRDQFAPHAVVYSLFDSDDAGRAASERLGRALGERHRPLALPIGKDITEYVVTHQGDLARWLRDVTAPEPVAIPLW